MFIERQGRAQVNLSQEQYLRTKNPISFVLDSSGFRTFNKENKIFRNFITYKVTNSKYVKRKINNVTSGINFDQLF